MNSAQDMPLLNAVLILSVAASLYFLPWIIAKLRHHSSSAGIFLTTLLLGWTGIGWVLALIWAASGRHAPPDRPQRTPAEQAFDRREAARSAEPLVRFSAGSWRHADTAAPDAAAQRPKVRATWIAGLAHSNPGEKTPRGAVAQARLIPGMSLELVPEPHNPVDADAVAIYRQGYRYGYVPAEHDFVISALREGRSVTATVDSVEDADVREAHVYVRVRLTIAG